ncbi:MAG: aminotransferase class V-fold PLP-dependent enzyme [Myxococcales bacterium]|nr:aminotransferase class V-fold PLP-dependent enzyme [Myxococcales bacterium]
MSYKHHFRRFLEADPERIHFAAHSHHLWPDVSFDAHVKAWLDAARMADQKWDAIFSEVVPRAQGHVARRLGLSDPTTIAFAPNTHELVMRILSCLPRGRALRVLTTDAEFHSFARQASRLEEDGELEVTRIPAEPHASFTERFAEAASKPGWDLVYLSHVFFNSGYAVEDLPRIVAAVPGEAFVVVDGYHAFGAIPVDLSGVEHRVFYLAGGYKYAMSGEGCCFVHAPPGYGARPRDTGWFAAFGALEDAQSPGAVAYAPGGARFLGATFDPSGLYRFNAVMDWLDAEALTPAALHAHVVRLQELFVAELGKESVPLRERELVVPIAEKSRGQFLTFETRAAADIHARLLAAGVVTDVRGDRLRFGFAIYHDDVDIGRGVARICSALG